MSSGQGPGSGGQKDTVDYKPKYVQDLSNIPLMGTDDYDPHEKKRALMHGEQAWLETDINQGQTIQDVTQAHRTACAAIATYILATGIVDPNTVRGGDLSDDGSRRREYAEQFRTIYQNRVSQILDKTPDAGGDGPGGGDSPGGNGPGDGTVSSTPFTLVTY